MMASLVFKTKVIQLGEISQKPPYG